MLLSLIIISLIIGFDQLSKFLIFGLPAKSIIGDFLWFESHQNTGAAFSMLSGNNLFFIILTSVACIGLFFIIYSKTFITKKIEKFALSLIFGGAVSNLFDRIIFSYVRDFIYLKFINFAIFNIADMAITIGAGLLIISILFFQKKELKDDRT